MTAALVETGVLGFGVITGLNVEVVRGAVEHLRTFSIELPKPPPPEPPRPRPKQARKAEGAPAAPKASPVVAPKPEVQLPAKQVIAAAVQAGTGASSSNGQGGMGTGTGAGGSGNGLGGGGGGGRFTPAQKITKIPDSQYRMLVQISGMDRGSVGISIRVTPEGRATNCRVIRSSGSPQADSLMCQLTEQYVRFRPALDPNGRPVGQQISWFPNWHR
jgi:protein TonB